MTDPFDALRDRVRPVDPDPAFAGALRNRVERALLHPREEPAMTTTDTRVPARATITPYLAVVDARAAVEFYVTALGATRRDEPILMPDGRVGHVEVVLGDSVLMLADEFPEMGLVAPANRGGASQSLRLQVADPDAVVAAALAAGATLDRPVADSPYGRGGAVLDPSGHRWMISREPVGADVVFASVWTPDAGRAARFYAGVLGWTTRSGTDPRDTEVVGEPGWGLHGGQAQPTAMLCYAVPDVDAAVVLVRAAGGTAGEPVDRPYGRVADCVDDQGLPFALLTGGAAPAPSGLEYLDLQVPDAGRARAFYGTVLGWRFTPGGHENGYWHPTAGSRFTSPFSGLSGGHAAAVVRPSLRVDDIAAAVAAVRAGGGSATDPTPGRHGTTSTCVDDQGMAFGLVQR